MSKEIKKDFFVKKLYTGFVVTEDGKEIAVENSENLKAMILRSLNFINTAIDNKTTINFGLSIMLDENVALITRENMPPLKFKDL